MKNTLFAILLVLPALAFGQQCSVPGDCIGFSLDMQTLATEKDCHKHCKNTENCQWYSYDNKTLTCNALFNKQGSDTSCTTCRHGENECQFPSQCFVKGGCKGGYIGNVDGLPNAEECLKTCYEDHDKCKWFSFRNATKVCNMYSSCVIDENEPNTISGERDCYENTGPTGFSKIFIHHYYDTAVQDVPSHNASGNGTVCTKPAQFPLQTRGSAGQIIDGHITICGGTSACYRLNQTSNTWSNFVNMTGGVRMYSADVMSPKGWWITGGYTNTYLSTSILWNGTAFTNGPALPSARADHCMVQIDETQTFMSGGYGTTGGGYKSDAFIYSWLNQEWLALPNMTTTREEHACTTYRDANGTTIILLAGDVSRPTSASTFNLGTRQWKTLPALPGNAWSATFIQDGDDIVLVNPYYRNLMRFNKTTERFTIIPGYPTAITGDYSTVIPVNDEHLTNCR